MADKITSKELMSQKDDFVIIDIRESDELSGGIIEDSIHMPLGLCIRNVKKKQIEEYYIEIFWNFFLEKLRLKLQR